MIFIGFFIGVVFTIIVIATTAFIALVHKNKIVRVAKRIEEQPIIQLFTDKKEPISILHRKTEAEEAYEHIKSLNTDRGGIPDSEI